VALSLYEESSNALQILDLLGEGISLRVVDVAHKLGVANSTAHRLLSTLRDNGYLRQQEGSSRYEAGPAALRLARRVNTERALERIALPHLQALRRDVNETVNLQVLVGNEVLFIASVEAHHQLRVALRVGTRGAAYANSGGKLLLAQLTDEEVRERLGEKLEGLAPHTIVKMDELLKNLSDIRQKGYALNTGETNEGVRAVAVGIPGSDGTVIAALSLAAPATRLSIGRVRVFLPYLKATALAIFDDYRGSTVYL
jgi:DNA-binding IclR family transcriptional regulator